MNIIPLAMGSLGVIPKQFRLKETGITVEIGQVLDKFLLGEAREY